ncbi:MAG: PEP-CTERM sorting domain-containing protein [Prosthecobacter sp.]|uniref:PEP-CTERM sorting domain-containing protein n=1 Tax=Prosthecobacter sp. TaxID=1965333 RepID=UPI003900C025
MKQHSIIKPILVLTVALAWLCGSVRASTVFWGSQFNDLLFDSAGQPLDSSFSFEIGTFGGFTPTYQNVDQWAANWKVFDRAFDPDANGWNAVEQFFVGTVNHNTGGGSDSPDANPSDVFAQGEVVYLWAYNSKNIVPGSEWALVTDGAASGDLADDWIIPDPADTVSSFNWQLTDANSAVIGGANGVQGEGTFSANPGTFSLQTAVVPEPGSAFLLLAAAATHVIRRARRLTRTTLP